MIIVPTDDRKSTIKSKKNQGSKAKILLDKEWITQTIVIGIKNKLILAKTMWWLI